MLAGAAGRHDFADGRRAPNKRQAPAGVSCCRLLGGHCHGHLQFLDVSPLDDHVCHGMYRLDAFALYFKRLFLTATAFVLLMGAEFSERFEHGVAEFYALVMFCATGMLVIASVNDFILLFRRARTRHDHVLHPDQLPPPTGSIARSGHQVSDPRRARQRVHGLRDRLYFRDDRHHELRHVAWACWPA